MNITRRVACPNRTCVRWATSGSSKRWLDRQRRDHFAGAVASDKSLRSRAYFKLEQLDQKHRIFSSSTRVVLDLGSAPGGWSSYASKKCGADGCRIIAMDRLWMEPVPGVEFIEGDLLEQSTQRALVDKLRGLRVDVVLSDMAPNTSGDRTVDHARSLELSGLAFEMARHYLSPDGRFVCKLFRGPEDQAFMSELKEAFRTVKMLKPAASRAESKEAFILAHKLR